MIPNLTIMICAYIVFRSIEAIVAQAQKATRPASGLGGHIRRAFLYRGGTVCDRRYGYHGDEDATTDAGLAANDTALRMDRSKVSLRRNHNPVLERAQPESLKFAQTVGGIHAPL